MQQTFFYLSIIQGFISQAIGIYAIFKGTYKPQRTTRLIYFLMNILFIGTLIAQGSWDALGFAFAQNLGGAVIFFLSFKYGVGGYSKVDIITLIGAFISGSTWVLTKNPTLALLMAITTDSIAFMPTLIKIFKFPKTEDWRFYFSDVIGTTFSLLSLKRFNLGDLAYPSYVFLLNVVGTILILWRSKKQKRELNPN